MATILPPTVDGLPQDPTKPLPPPPFISVAERKRRVLVEPRTLSLFCRHLSVMLVAGIPLARCLKQLKTQPENPAFGDVIGRVGQLVESGMGVTASLEWYPKVFNNLFIAMVRAGETHGKFPETLLYVAELMDKEDSLRRKIKSALAYPMIVLVVSLLLCWAQLVFLMPQFIGMYQSMHLKLPALTQMVIVAFNIFSDWRWDLLLLVAFVGLIRVYRVMRETRKGRRKLDELVEQIPFFGRVVHKVAVSRMARSLSTLFASGVPVVKSIRLSGDACGNEILRDEMYRTTTDLEDGQMISYRFHPDFGLFDPIVYHMISAGEESGHLEIMLVKLASYYEQDVDYVFGGLASIVEPLLTIFVGIMVGCMVLAMFLPLYELFTRLS